MTTHDYAAMSSGCAAGALLFFEPRLAIALAGASAAAGSVAGASTTGAVARAVAAATLPLDCKNCRRDAPVEDDEGFDVSLIRAFS